MQRVDIIKSNEISGNETDDSLKEQSSGVSVYLDMDANANWLCYTQPGALRRIISKWYLTILESLLYLPIHCEMLLEYV